MKKKIVAVLLMLVLLVCSVTAYAAKAAGGEGIKLKVTITRKGSSAYASVSNTDKKRPVYFVWIPNEDYYGSDAELQKEVDQEIKHIKEDPEVYYEFVMLKKLPKDGYVGEVSEEMVLVVMQGREDYYADTHVLFEDRLGAALVPVDPPKTGDTFNPALAVLLMAVSAAGIVLIGRKRRA